ncbi:DNA-deoxyinosine glycosylase [Aquabacterium parvum]|uniref:DNA-deoxyinosine glycosylase n=1 Tax=Aquabacterium parvum TaxID=70584 RepID=UPI0009FACA13|nr:DNA-deoxyinosine glycosylase [Aquabacterium parvum]
MPSALIRTAAMCAAQPPAEPASAPSPAETTKASNTEPRRLNGLGPVAGTGARLLILGSFPSEASLRAQQYYAHPRNHFWPILSAIWGLRGDQALSALPYDDRLPIVTAHGLAIWDVYAGCEREGSLDSAIRAAQLNDLVGLQRRLPTLRAIAHNGGESARHMKLTQALGLPVHKLPSSSPANASWSVERKVQAWREVFQAAGVVQPPCAR